MDKKKRVIYYFGSQKELIEIFDEFFRKLNSEFFDLDLKNFSNRIEFIDSFCIRPPDLVIFDFCETDNIPREYCEIIRILKGINYLKRIAFAGVFKDKEQIEKFSSVVGLGVQYIFVKGEDTNQVLHNLYYIAYEDESHLPKYARAKKFELPYTLSSVAYIAEIGDSSITIDMEIETSDEKIKVETNLFQDFKATEFYVQSSYLYGTHFNTYHSQKVEIPFAGGWDESDNSVSQDTYQTWFNLSKESFSASYSDVLIFSKNTELLAPSINLAIENTNIRVIYREDYDEKDKEVFKFDIGLLVFEITTEESYESFNKLVAEFTYKNTDNPILIVLNHRSTSEALRKLFNYEFLISYSKKLSVNQIQDLVKALVQKKLEKGKLHYKFKDDDPRGICGVKVAASITSITENDITFKTPVELPFYSVLTIDCPIKMYLLTIPQIVELSPNIHGYHYMALIMGISSEDSNYLRMYVNKLLKDPPKQWSYIPIDQLHGKNAEDVKAKAKAIDEENRKSKEALLKSEAEKMEMLGKEDSNRIRIKSKNKKSKL